MVPYIAYLFYPPLYIAGPIMCYNSFIAQVQSTVSPVTLWNQLTYTARAGLSFVSLESP